MSLSHEAMLDLMAYADGELEGDARERTEELLRTSDEARRVVDAMRGIGDVVRELPVAGAAELPAADGIADSVMAAIAREPAVSPAGGEVVTLAERRAAARGRYVAVTVGVLALAASAFLFLRTNENPTRPGPTANETPHETPPMVQPVPGASQEPAPPAPSALAQAEKPDEKAGEVDLEEVDSPKHHVSVFYVPKSVAGAAANANAASVVVWIDDHGGH